MAGCGCGKRGAGTAAKAAYELILRDGTVHNVYDSLMEARTAATTIPGARVRVTSKR